MPNADGFMEVMAVQFRRREFNSFSNPSIFLINFLALLHFEWVLFNRFIAAATCT
jgi:hypothetical protein